jgi:hypothetical protein
MGNNTNQSNQEEPNSGENTSFYDQADGKLNQKLSKGVKADPESEVKENEDASLQDESYSFDEANTDNEEYHDADEFEDFDIDNDDDFVQ